MMRICDFGKWPLCRGGSWKRRGVSAVSPSGYMIWICNRSYPILDLRIFPCVFGRNDVVDILYICQSTQCNEAKFS